MNTTSRLVRGAALGSTRATYYLTHVADRTARSAKNLFTVRSAILTAIAVRMVTAPMPVPVAHASEGSVLPDEAGQPPSTLAAVAFTPSAAGDVITVTAPNLEPIQIGTSRASEQEAAAAAQAVAQAAAQAKADAARREAAQRWIPAIPTVSPGSIQDIAKQAIIARYGDGGWEQDFGYLSIIARGESGWNNNAQNPTTSAYGICQFLDSTWRGTGISKTADPVQQIQACLIYSEHRYGGLQNAAQHWLAVRTW